MTHKPNPTPFPLWSDYIQKGVPFLGWLSFWGAIISAKKKPFFHSFLSVPQQAQLDTFHQQLEPYDTQTIFEHLQREAGKRTITLVESFMDLWQHSMPSCSSAPQEESQEWVIWQKGNTRLLDLSRKYPGVLKEGPAVLMVPSLLNRGWIFDLKPRLSFASYLAHHGIRPLVLEWGEPEGPAIEYGVADYLEEQLLPLLAFLGRESKMNLFLLGYCMGGLMTLAALMHHPLPSIKGIGLMAVPWDFSAMPQLPSTWHPFLLNLIHKARSEKKPLPGSLVQGYFQLLSWPDIAKKLYGWNQASTEVKEELLPLERWLSQGYSLNYKVAEECFHQWYQHNSIYKTRKIANTLLDFSGFPWPLWGAMPLKDKVVPPKAASPLFTHFKQSEIILPDVGHLGLFSSRQSQQLVWEPFVKWIKKFNKRAL